MWKEIYEKNRDLDEIFIKRYGNDEYMYEKNCIALLAEIGEFVNETKCFKYWSIKKPKKDDLLGELADCFTMIMYFYNFKDLNIPEYKVVDNNKNILEIINDTYILGTNLYKNCDQELLDKIFYNLLLLGNLCDCCEEEIIDAIKKAHIKIENRLNSDY